MRVGILGLALIFFLSGIKFLQDSGLFKKDKEEKSGQQKKYDLRKLLFALLMLVVGTLVLVYYFVTM